MTNNFYTPAEVAVPGTTVRSQQFNNNNGGVQAGFDKLPDPENNQTSAHRYAVDTGAVENAYEITLDFKSQVTSYITGMEIAFLASKQNSGPCTINVNGLAPKFLVTTDNFQLAAGSIVADSLITARYDGTAFRILNIIFRDVKFDTTETVTLTAGQTTVTFSTVSTTATSYYVEGQLVDRGRLLLNVDYTVTNSTTIELEREYPAGTRILAAQSDANSSDNLNENIYEGVFNRNIKEVIVGATFKQYTDDGRDLTPRLLYSTKLYTSVETPPGPGDTAWTFTGAVVDNGDGTIDVPTDAGTKVFSRIDAEAIGRREVTDGIGLTTTPQQSVATIVTDLQLGALFPILLTANTVVSAPTNVVASRDIGREIEYKITGDSGSVFTVTFDSVFKLAAGSYTHSGVNAIDVIAFRWDGTNWLETRRSQALA